MHADLSSLLAIVYEYEYYILKDNRDLGITIHQNLNTRYGYKCVPLFIYYQLGT